MIRANLLLDDGTDPVVSRGPATAGVVTGLGIFVLCAALAFVAHQKKTEEIEQTRNDIDNAESQLEELRNSSAEVRAIGARGGEIQAFIDETSEEAAAREARQESIEGIGPLLAGRPRGSAERQTFEENGWDARWTLAELQDWSMELVDDTWTFAGETEDSEDLLEVARRLQDADGLSDGGYESMTVREVEPAVYAFVWSAEVARAEAEQPAENEDSSPDNEEDTGEAGSTEDSADQAEDTE